MAVLDLLEPDPSAPADAAGLVTSPRAERRRPGRPAGLLAGLRTRSSRVRLGLAGLAVLVLAGGWFGWQLRPVTNPAIVGTQTVSVEELESVYGAHIDLIALLAGGGLVEMRFQVTNADKAQALFGTVDQMPKLALQGSDVVLESAKGMKHNFTVLDGATYFILYPNPGNVVHKGTQVSLVVNGYRIPDLEVQK